MSFDCIDPSLQPLLLPGLPPITTPSQHHVPPLSLSNSLWIPICVAYTVSRRRPFTGAWLTYQGPHPQRKLTLHPPAAINCNSISARRVTLLSPLSSMLDLGWLALVQVFCRQLQLLWVDVGNSLVMSKETVSLQSFWPLALIIFHPLIKDGSWALVGGVWYRCSLSGWGLHRP